jgi:hypothetical protein
MSTSAASALADLLYITIGWSPFSANNAAVQQIRAADQADPGDVAPADGIVVGWTDAKIFTDIVAKSCSNLTRTGLEKTYRSISDLKVTGLMGDLDFTKIGQPPARAFNISRVDSSTPGAERLVSQPFTTPDLVKDYPVPTS